MEFSKGHGTQNDFVVLPDLDARLDLDARTRSRRCAIATAGSAPTVFCGSRAPEPSCRRGAVRTPRRRRRRRLVHGLPQRATGRSPRCAATASGSSRTTSPPTGWRPGGTSWSAAAPAESRSGACDRARLRRCHRGHGTRPAPRHFQPPRSTAASTAESASTSAIRTWRASIRTLTASTSRGARSDCARLRPGGSSRRGSTSRF